MSTASVRDRHRASGGGGGQSKHHRQEPPDLYRKHSENRYGWGANLSLMTVVYCLCLVLFLAPPDSWFAMWPGVSLKKYEVLSD